jgi:protein phosphatase
LRKRAKAGILVEEEALMALAEPLTATIPTAPGRKPRDDELDLFGLTHPGKVRPENQDHFLLGTVNPQVVIHGTSLPEPDNLPLRGERLATVMLVADGVGSGSGGGEASRLATESITRYVSSTLRCYHSAGSSAEEEFFDALRQAALEAHSTVRTEAAGRPDAPRMATTLTLGIAVWPWLYVVQVGDSRCYRPQGWGAPAHDQRSDRWLRTSWTAAPFPRAAGRLAVQSRAGERDRRRRGQARSDQSGYQEAGLCRAVVLRMVSPNTSPMRRSAPGSTRWNPSEQVCRELLDLALERGGSDNITVLAGRARRR